MNSTIMLAWVAWWVASVWAMRCYTQKAPQWRLIDIPNARSSHTQPTPRGAGLIMGGAMGVASALSVFFWGCPEGLSLAWWCGLALIVGVGFWDDCGHASPWVRLSAQGVAVCALVLPLAPWWPACWYSLPPSVFVPLWLVSGVWAINLMNFMDGADGLAASESSGLMIFGLCVLLPLQAWWLAALCASMLCLNFTYLFWNWPPARLFMGDSGSTLLGYVQVSVALMAQCVHGVPLWLWVMVHALFGVDATLTLVRRACAGEPILQPHKRHAFQRLLQTGWSHQRLLSVKGGLNAALVLLALWTHKHPEHLWTALGLVLMGVLALYLWIEKQRSMFA